MDGRRYSVTSLLCTKKKPHDGIRAKLTSVAGDTFTEALVALLVAALATTLLAMMVTSSVSISSRSEAEMKSLYGAQSLLASGANAGSIDVTITSDDGKIGSSSSSSVVWKVPLYKSDDFACYKALEIEDVQP